MPWTMPVPVPVDGPTTGPELPLAQAYLDHQRATLLNVCAGLDASAMAVRPITGSTLSLAGLIRHLAKVERIWFRRRVAGEDVPWLFPRGSDEEFTEVRGDGVEDDAAVYLDESARARDIAREADPDADAIHVESPMSVRMVLLHVTGEYARHNGHADVIRELIDGVTGR